MHRSIAVFITSLFRLLYVLGGICLGANFREFLFYLCFNSNGRGSASGMDTSDGWGHDGPLWTPRLNPLMTCAPSETRSTAASTAEPTRSSSWPTPCLPPA